MAGRPRMLHTRIKLAADAVRKGADIPNWVIPAICRDRVFRVICEACNIALPNPAGPDVDDDDHEGWCTHCQEYH